jgi:anti-sigma factor RsiW
MNCEESRVLLDAYLDDELDLVHSLEIENHLADCTACANILKNHRTLRAAMQDDAMRYRPSLQLRERITPKTSTRRMYPLIALAASLLVAAFFAGRLQPRESATGQEILDSHLRSLLPGHLADVQSTDQHTVKPWFNGKLNFSPPVTDLAPQGFPLTGGRVDSIGGRAVAALVYRRSQHPINVYVWPAPGSSDKGFDKSAQQGYNFTHWTRSGLEWWAISDLNANELADFAALLRAATP